MPARRSCALAILSITACQQSSPRPDSASDDGSVAVCQALASEDLFPHFDFSGDGSVADGGEGPPAPGGVVGGPGSPAGLAGNGASGGPMSLVPTAGSGGAPGGGSGPPGGVTTDDCVPRGNAVQPPQLHNVANAYGFAADVLVPDPTCGFLALDDFATSKLLGTNGRHCMTCHSDDGEWTSTPEQFRARFDEGVSYLVVGNQGVTIPPPFPPNHGAERNDDLEPAFRAVDGANSPLADVSTPEAREKAYSLLLTRGVFRIGLPMPENADFDLVNVADPYGFASSEELSLFRRSPPMANLRFHTTLMFDGRDTQECEPLRSSLERQAAEAVERHAEGERPGDDIVDLIVDGELTIYTAQVMDEVAGDLSEDGAKGGPWTLAQVPFYWGINAFDVIDPRGAAYTSEVFGLFATWRGLSGDSERERARALIAEGEQLFNLRQFEVLGVSGFNDVLGRPTVVATCGACHNTPNVGTSSQGRMMDIGTSDESVSAELPLYTFRAKASGAVVTTSDPGRALASGRWADMNRMKVPSLRALAGRAPYFHNGIAKSLEAAVEHHDRRFGIGLTGDEKAALVAFLRAL